jgi:hypothetical protein
MTEGDLLTLKQLIEGRLEKIVASQPPAEPSSGTPRERPEGDIEVLYRTVAAILDHLAQRAAQS